MYAIIQYVIVWLNGLDKKLCNHYNTLIVYNNINKILWASNDFSNLQNIDELKIDLIKAIEMELKSNDKYEKYLNIT